MYVSPAESKKVQARKAAVHAANVEARRKANLAKMAQVAGASK